MKKNSVNSNILYTYFLRVIMYIFPLITLPYLLRVLGVANYGVIALTQAVTNYFVLFINYGFNFTGARDIAKNSEIKKNIDKIFSEVVITKFFLLLLSIPIILVIGILVPTLKENFLSYLLIILMLVNEVVFPVFLFQGLENMKIITIINIISRVMGLVLIFIFVKKENDLFYAILLTNCSSLLGGLIGFVYARKKYTINFRFPKISNIIFQLKNGWNLFVAQGMSSMFSNSNVFIIGLLLSPVYVGYYSVAEKIMRMCASFVAPFSNAIYPVIVRLFDKSKLDALKYLKKYFLIGFSIFFVGGLILFFGSGIIIKLINGTPNDIISINLKIMAIIPLSIFVNNIYGTQILLQLGKEKKFRNLIILCGLLLPILTLIFIQVNKNYGASVALLISELLLTFLMIVEVEKNEKTNFLI